MRKPASASTAVTPIESMRLVDNAPHGLRPEGVAKLLVATLGRRLIDAPPAATTREVRAS